MIGKKVGLAAAFASVALVAVAGTVIMTKASFSLPNLLGGRDVSGVWSGWARLDDPNDCRNGVFYFSKDGKAYSVYLGGRAPQVNGIGTWSLDGGKVFKLDMENKWGIQLGRAGLMDTSGRYKGDVIVIHRKAAGSDQDEPSLWLTRCDPVIETAVLKAMGK